jgi:hypothetical protein
MQCPHCKKDLLVPNYAPYNAMAYNEKCLVVTLCCNNPVTLIPHRSYSVEAYDGMKRVDDWGTPFLVEKK